LPKSTAKTVDQFVAEALEIALKKGGETRLITVGIKPEGAGLFPDEKGTRKAAIDMCLNSEPALLKVVRTEQVQVGKQKQSDRFVSITLHGINHLFQHLSPDKIGELLVQCSQQISRDQQIQQEQLEKLCQARQRMTETVQELIQQFAKAADRLRATADDTSEKNALLKAKLECLPLPTLLLPTASTRPPIRATTTEDESEYRRRVAQQLVFAWQETAPESREPIERALFNVGAEPVGQAGERVEFSGRLHESPGPIFPGDPVEIVQPGWLLRDESQGYLLACVQVKAILDSVAESHPDAH